MLELAGNDSAPSGSVTFTVELEEFFTMMRARLNERTLTSSAC